MRPSLLAVVLRPNRVRQLVSGFAARRRDRDRPTHLISHRWLPSSRRMATVKRQVVLLRSSRHLRRHRLPESLPGLLPVDPNRRRPNHPMAYPSSMRNRLLVLLVQVVGWPVVAELRPSFETERRRPNCCLNRHQELVFPSRRMALRRRNRPIACPSCHRKSTVILAGVLLLALVADLPRMLPSPGPPVETSRHHRNSVPVAHAMCHSNRIPMSRRQRLELPV